MASRTLAATGFTAPATNPHVLTPRQQAGAGSAGGGGKQQRDAYEIRACRDWAEDYQALNQRESALDKGLAVPREDMGKLAYEIFKEATEIERERQDLITELAGRLQRLKGTVSALSSRVRQVERGESYIREVAALIDESEQAVNDLRTDQRDHYEALRAEERALSQEVEAFWREQEEREQREEAERGALASERQQPPSTSSPLRERGRDRGEGAVHPDVVAFDQFLAKHGPTGGWHPDDHAEWCRILTTCRNDYAAAADVASAQLLGLTRAEVEAHALWDAQFRDLQFRKRAAVQLWRARKEIDRERQQAALTAEEGVLRAAEEREQRRREEEEFRQRQREALEAWKQQRDEKARRAEELERAHRERAAQRQAEERARQAEKKAALDAFRRQREEEMRARAELSVQSSQLSTPRSIDPEVLAKMHERDLALVQKRKRIQEQRDRAKEEARARLEELARAAAVEVPRDPTRLLRPTSAAEERRKAEKENVTQGFIRHTQKLATPSWRKGM